MQMVSILADAITIREDIVRLHVIANSDSQADQVLKLEVRDTVLSYLQPLVEEAAGKEQAEACIQKNLSEIERIAEIKLVSLGKEMTVRATYGPEEYGKREYDTFCLPSGVYDSLRIELGAAEGKNWWCVVFPSLCLPAAGENFQSAAVSAGFGQDLTDTLSQHNGYQVRFFFLDILGKLENFLHFS